LTCDGLVTDGIISIEKRKDKVRMYACTRLMQRMVIMIIEKVI